jgi:hypothetical protein
VWLWGGWVEEFLLTAIIALLTLSFLINPSLDRFSISSLLVAPEQYHAIALSRLLIWVSADSAARAVLNRMSMQRRVFEMKRDGWVGV